MGRESRRAFWAKHVESFAASRQSRRAYCAAHGLSRNTLDYWRRRLRGEAGPAAPEAGSALGPAFVPVRVAAPLDDAALTLHWPGGLRMELPRDVDPRWLAQVLSGLR